MQVHVAIGEHPYNVHVGAGILTQAGEIVCRALREPAARAFVVADAGVPQSAVKALLKSLADRSLVATTTSITPSEPSKSWPALHSLLSQMAQARLERTDLVIALGGGITGDIAGFASATYRRGVPVVQCPTTLLAMVDSSVGGKTGINLDVPGSGLMKNMVGAFWQPTAVVADVELLRSLPARELRAGLAECIKHALMSADVEDPDLLEWTRTNMPRIVALDAPTLQELVARNVAAKARIVCGDEREQAKDGGRALLNLGHTFAHAIETLPDLTIGQTPGTLLHGEAVALGLIAAATCAAKMGLAPQAFATDVATLIRNAGLPTAVSGLPPDAEVRARMAHDKKSRAGELRLILPLGNGRAKVVSNPPEEAITAGLTAIRA
jgi:3-dehydroquinate synthase